MRNFKKSALLVIAVSTVIQTAWANEAGMIPIVPVSVVTNMGSTAPAKIPEPGGTHTAGDMALNSSSTIVMRRGVNQIIPAAIYHLNRIVTPFIKPIVKTGTGAEVSVEDNVIYVTTADTAPVTLFIYEEGNQDIALNLTLVPRRIPAREVFLDLEDGVMALNGRGNAKAESWEKSQPYVETIRAVFRGLALGDLPQGYSLSKYPTSRATPNCSMDGLNFSFKNGQLLSGHSLQVSVGIVQNTTSRPIEIREAVCGGWEVAAVAAWPNNMLEPGQRSEIYVAERLQRTTKSTSKRPSLLGGN